MAGLQAVTESVVCSKCGLKYGKRRGNFATSLCATHKGTGTLHVCRTCLDEMFNAYLAECEDTACACRQVCRKLDIYWNKRVFESVVGTSATRTIMSCYMAKVKVPSYIGKSYDDTLREEGKMWDFMNDVVPVEKVSNGDVSKEEEVEIPEETKAFWGTGYTSSMYAELSERFDFWLKELNADDMEDLDAGTKAIIRQICHLELDINRDRVAGKSVDKNVNILNTLLGSANLKPAQKKIEENVDAEMLNTPLGVWLWRYENKRPLPEIDKDMQDVNGIKKYVFTWMGHVSKMLGLKNTYTRLYEEEIERLRVEKPEYVDEDDETLLIDSYSQSELRGGVDVR